MSERTFPPSVQPGIPRIAPRQKNWSRHNIGDLFEVVSRPAGIKDDQQYRLITVRRSRGGLDQRSELFGREISVKSQFFVEEGDFLISKRQIVHGACGMVPAELGGAIVSNEYAVLRCSPLLDPEYLKQLIHSVYLQQTFFHSSIGVHIEKMIFKISEWFKWPINLPTLPEQRKIAGFLGAVDTKIAQQAEKKRLLEDYRKGCMQQLFSQKFRFKDDSGKDFPVWEVKPLQQLADRVTEKNTARTIVDVLTNSAVQGIISQGDYFDRDIANAENLDRYTIVQIGDFVYNPRISVKAPVGPIKRNSLRPGVMSPLYDVFRFSSRENLDFWEQYFNATTWYKYMKQVANYGARHDRMAISSYDFFNMPVPYPHPDEQRKIADFLSAIDRKIDLVGQELTHARTFKQGLLQQMFV